MKIFEKPIESPVLYKSYKTDVSYKSALTRYENQVKDDIRDIQSCIDNGWTTYLGDPIKPRLNNLQRELVKINKEREKLQTLLTNI